jgi:hypothetical protein
MRRVVSAIFLAGLMLATPAAASFDSEPFLGRGVVRAVRWIEGDVMLQSEDGFHLVLVDDDAGILNAFGAPIALRDLPLGSAIEYVGQYWEGLIFASSVKVSAAPLAVSAR